MSLKDRFLNDWEQDVKENKYTAWPTETAEWATELKELEGGVYDTWRWGEIFRYVYTDGNEFIEIIFKNSSGDERLDPLDMDLEVNEVFPEEVTITKYVRRKNV